MTDDNRENVVPLTPTPVKNDKNTRGGRLFRPGNSGRPRGAKNKLTRTVMDMLAKYQEPVTGAVIKAAATGDMAAAKLILDRICPVPKRGSLVTFPVPDDLDAAGVAAALSNVVKAMAAGELSTDEAAQAAAVLETRRKAIETEDFEIRLRALEARRR